MVTMVSYKFIARNEYGSLFAVYDDAGVLENYEIHMHVQTFSAVDKTLALHSFSKRCL